MGATGRTAVLLAVGLCVTAVSEATGATHKPPARCPHITGKAVVSTTHLRVVRRRDAQGFDQIFGCALPHGRVRLLGTQADEGLGDSSIDAGPAAGTWVRIDEAGSDQYGGGSSAGLADVRTGREFSVFSAGYQMGDPGPSAVLDRFLFDNRGRSVTAVAVPTGSDPATARPTGSDELIVAHAPDGTPVVVDHGPTSSIPPASLTFEAGVATWTHDGDLRDATFG
ncbi:MAG: hypothetical protein JWM71_903 [Solirubrobacteraceae bacterium]|nr:hypothetical protein [Solirubrobacteraceae bacterium]